MNVCKFMITPLRVVVGGSNDQNGMVRAVWTSEVGICISLVDPSFASASTISVLSILVRTLCIEIFVLVHYICYTIASMSSLFGWWCCEGGCLMWFFVRYTLFRLYVSM